MGCAYGFFDDTLYVIEAESEEEAYRKLLARLAKGPVQASLWDVPGENDVRAIHEGDILEFRHRWADGESSLAHLERLAKSLREEKYNFDLPFGCCSQVISTHIRDGCVIAVHKRIPRPFWLRRPGMDDDDDDEQEEYEE